MINSSSSSSSCCCCCSSSSSSNKFLMIFSHQFKPVIIHWSLCDSKDSQLSRTLRSILADLKCAGVWMVSILHLSKSTTEGEEIPSIVKKNFQAQQSVKNLILTVLWDMKMLIIGSFNRKTVQGRETHWLSVKENFPGTAVSKKVHADSFLGHEKSYH